VSIQIKATAVFLVLPSRRAARFAAYFSVLSGGLALLGWYLDIALLRSLFPHFAPMPPNAALCFILAGLAIWTASRNQRHLSEGFGVVLGMIGGLTLVETLFSLNLGIDRMVLPLSLPSYALSGRMSAITALNMLALGFVFLNGFDLPSLLNRVLILLIGVTSGIALISFLYDFASLYALFIYEGMAFTTALSFIVLVAGYFLSQPSSFLTRLTSDTSAGLTGRRLLPIALFMPLVLGWLIVQLSNARVFNGVVGIVLLVLLTTGVFVVVISWTMRSLYAEDGARQESAHNALALAVQLERNRLMNDFVKNTLHDLRTPLTSIGTSAYIARRTEDPARQLDRLENVQSQVKRITEILDQFAEMVRLNQMEGVALSALNLNGAVQTVVSQLDTLAEKRGITVDTDLNFDLPPVAAADLLLKTALSEILNNALRYTPSGGRVMIRTMKQGHKAVVEVCDTGVGIPQEAIEQVFEAQFKVNEARTSDGSTGGFGLSMVKRIAELHRGSVEIESIVDKGTTVRLFIPLDMGTMG